MKKLLMFVALFSVCASFLFNEICHVFAEDINSSSIETQAYTRWKSVSVLITYEEYTEPVSTYYYYYNDGVYAGTLSLVGLERRPGWGGNKYAWYATYRGQISTGGHMVPYSLESDLE